MRSKTAVKQRHPEVLPGLALLIAVAAFAAGSPAAEKVDCTTVKSIGIASMSDDGVIVLRLRSLPPGPIAEGTLRYAPGEPRYDEVRKHIGGIKPGESKPVPPWC